MQRTLILVLVLAGGGAAGWAAMQPDMTTLPEQATTWVRTLWQPADEPLRPLAEIEAELWELHDKAISQSGVMRPREQRKLDRLLEDIARHDQPNSASTPIAIAAASPSTEPLTNDVPANDSTTSDELAIEEALTHVRVQMLALRLDEQREVELLVRRVADLERQWPESPATVVARGILLIHKIDFRRPVTPEVMQSLFAMRDEYHDDQQFAEFLCGAAFEYAAQEQNQSSLQVLEHALAELEEGTPRGTIIGTLVDLGHRPAPASQIDEKLMRAIERGYTSANTKRGCSKRK